MKHNLSPHSSNPDIKITELMNRLQNGEMLHMLDVREPIEFHTNNIGGTNIPLAQLSDKVALLNWKTSEEIIVICKVGLRSETAQAIYSKWVM